MLIQIINTNFVEDQKILQSPKFISTYNFVSMSESHLKYTNLYVLMNAWSPTLFIHSSALQFNSSQFLALTVHSNPIKLIRNVNNLFRLLKTSRPTLPPPHAPCFQSPVVCNMSRIIIKTKAAALLGRSSTSSTSNAKRLPMRTNYKYLVLIICMWKTAVERKFQFSYQIGFIFPLFLKILYKFAHWRSTALSTSRLAYRFR